jgi:putative ABC transport system permease protein
MFDALRLDVRYCLRSLLRSPGFSSVVILTLMLAVGANTALFSLLNAVVLRKLPVPEPDRLVNVALADPQSNITRMIYLDVLAAFEKRQHVFETIAPYSGGVTPIVRVPGGLADAVVESATPEWYALLGVHPFLGRLLSTADAPSPQEAAPVAVISYRFWQRYFGGDPSAIGQHIAIDNSPPLVVIGVTPPQFHGLQVDGAADVAVPLAVMRQWAGDLRRPHRARNLIGRLRPGVTIEQARAEVQTLWPDVQRTAMPPSLPATDQQELRNARVKVESIAGGFSDLRARYEEPIVVLVAGAALLLVIGCINLSGLLLSRAAARHQQLNVRIALGASRARIAQLHLIEGLLLSAAGTALALPLAWWLSGRLSEALWSGLTPLAMSMTPDARVFGITAAIAITTGLLIGVLPAWTAGRLRVSAALQSPGRTTAGSTRSGRALVVAQVALSLMLLAGAALFVRTLDQLRATQLTGDTRHALFTRIYRDPSDRRQHDDPSYYSTLVSRLAAVPGVESVGLSMYFPVYFKIALPLDSARLADDPGQAGTLVRNEYVSPRFFDTIGVARLRGRDFTWDDNPRGVRVAIVNATLARALDPSQNVVGRRLAIGTDAAAPRVEIVGVVEDAGIGDLRQPHGAMMFRPFLQSGSSGTPIVTLRAAGDPKAYAGPLTEVVASLGRHVVRGPLVRTLDDQLDQTLLQERFVAGLSSFFAALAVLLACVGVFGLLAYAVVRRTREIGIRIAVGATRPSILRMVVAEAAALVAAGIALGVPGALVAGRLIQSLLYGVGPNDVVTIGTAAAAFLVVGTCAGLWPALRAASTDPLAALRHE